MVLLKDVQLAKTPRNSDISLIFISRGFRERSDLLVSSFRWAAQLGTSYECYFVGQSHRLGRDYGQVRSLYSQRRIKTIHSVNVLRFVFRQKGFLLFETEGSVLVPSTRPRCLHMPTLSTLFSHYVITLWSYLS